MSRLLIVGCSHAEIPLILAAKRLGHWVATVGNDPHGLGIRKSDQHFSVDFSDTGAVLEVFDKGGFDGVIPGCNDFAAFTVATLVEERSCLGFDDFETTRKIHHKDVFRHVSQKLGLHIPKFVVAESVNEGLIRAENCTFPLIVKPTDLTGGKGITVAQSSHEIESAIGNALHRSRSKKVVIEEFCDGGLRSALFLVIRGLSQLLVSSDEFMQNNPFLVASAVSRTEKSLEECRALEVEVQTLVDELRLVDGIVHVQYVVSESSFVILEICRRPPGDLYLMLVEWATGYNISEALVRLANGEELAPPILTRHAPEVFRLCLMAECNGAVRRWDISPSLGSKVSYRIDLRPRRTVISDFLNQKLGIVLGFGRSNQELVDLVRDHKSHLEIDFE